MGPHCVRPGPQLKGGIVFCRECGKQIEEGARFCRYCGKAQADPGGSQPPAAAAGLPGDSVAPMTRPGPEPGLEGWLRQLFPRHHLQDEFMHVGSIAAFFMAVIGFVLGFFPAVTWLGTNFLLGSVALLLFLILRESTLSHIRVRSGGAQPAGSSATRYYAGRQSAAPSVPAEVANAESSPPTTPRPPATPR